MSKTKMNLAVEETTDAVMLTKKDLATQAIDLLMFGGEVGGMVKSMAGMMGIEEVSIALILPQKNKRNIRRFLACLNLTIFHVLDDQVDLDLFTKILAEQIKIIQRIVAEEKE